MLKAISPRKIYNFLIKYYRWILIIIFALSICFNMVIYYQHVYLAIRVKPEPQGRGVLIDQETLDKVIDNLNIREENLSRVKEARYVNPF